MIEINLLLFIPILRLIRINNSPSILGIKYFFIQSLGSIIFFIRIIISLLIYFSSRKLSFVISIRLLIKLGLPPFHIWLFNLIIDLDWKLFFFNIFLTKNFTLLYVKPNYIWKYRPTSYLRTSNLYKIVNVLFRNKDSFD